MPCACGSRECRGTVGAFATLPAEKQRWYREHDLVAPHLREEPAAEHAATRAA
jgi:hypothetical protein